MKKLIGVLLSLTIVATLAWRQYKFNMQMEWWANETGRFDDCDRADFTNREIAEIKFKTGMISKRGYDETLRWIDKERLTTCEPAHRWYELNPEMPFTDKWYEHRKLTGLDSLWGWYRDQLVGPLPVDGKVFDEHKPTVRLKKSWYGGGVAECFVTQAEPIAGSPLPLMSRYLYELSCKNDKSEAEGVHGFIATSTSDNLERMP